MANPRDAAIVTGASRGIGAATARLLASRGLAVLVNYAKTQFTGLLPEAWLFVLGALFVLVTLFFPRGIAGVGRPLWARAK